ncbi:AraC family transcriptional regulator [Pseudopedobacter beijingensis]|uniref:AraC family transcriptional regulator n=1 Tax=Pseudopedobacter beijingensis TaxID=1207056 RepID=A0ABW4ICT4_9SPHI
MKAQFHKVPTRLQTSYSIRNDVSANFGTIWHYHPELELHYVKKGEGLRFIGDNISNFSAGEMVLLGENLPHTWRCKDEYFSHNSDLNVEATVIHFLPNCLGQDLLNLPEAFQIPKLYEKAKKGLIIKGNTKKRLEVLMHDALNAVNLDRLSILLSILNTLAYTEEYEFITSTNAFYKANNSDTERINKICTYTLTNYKNEITLEEISSLSNLSVTSFCRYFKQMTKKTFYDFLTEIRISHACRMLVKETMTVEGISMECGFNNPSNFYRHFKKVMGCTPVEYKSKFK